MIDHELRKARAVYEHDALDRACKFESLRRIGRRCDEDALVRALASEGAIEGLNFGATHGLLPSLSLDIDFLKA